MKYGVQVDVSSSPVWVDNGGSTALASRSKADRERLVKAAMIRLLSKFGITVTSVMELDDDGHRKVEPFNSGAKIGRTAGR